MSGFLKQIIQISLILTLVAISQSNLAFAQTTSSNVDIVIEPASYIPQFYKGRPLFVSQGTARIVAIPNVIVGGKRVSSKNLTFKWIKNGVFLPPSTNTGNDSIIVNGNIPVRDMDISVQVIDSSGKILAENSKIISANTPKVIFYENSPLYGTLLNKALASNHTLGSKEELNVLAKPYFFDIENQDSNDVEYKWFVNGIPVSLAGKKNSLLLKQESVEGVGSASISVEVNNLVRIFQFASNSFGINFGQ